MKTFRDQLIELDAPSAMTNWVGDKTLNESWATCERGDWMLWLAATLAVDFKLVVSAACDCAELADQYLDDNTRDPARNAVATARRWVAGNATARDCRHAADVADAYADSADSADSAEQSAADAVAAGYSAIYAATVAAGYYAADAAAADSISIAAAADAAYTAAAYAARAHPTTDRGKILKQCADIVRKYIAAEMIGEKLK